MLDDSFPPAPDAGKRAGLLAAIAAGLGAATLAALTIAGPLLAQAQTAPAPYLSVVPAR